MSDAWYRTRRAAGEPNEGTPVSRLEGTRHG